MLTRTRQRTSSAVHDPISKHFTVYPNSSSFDDASLLAKRRESVISKVSYFETQSKFMTNIESDCCQANFDEIDHSVSDKTPFCPPNKHCFEAYHFPWISIIVILFLFLSKLSFISIQTLFSIYVINRLNYSQSISTIFYHSMNAVSSFFTILGATIADNFLGRLTTIVLFGLIYAVGNIIIPISVSMNNHIYSLIVGIFLLAIGEGGIKACLSAFGADQLSKRIIVSSSTLQKVEYIDGDQEKIENYFSLIYFVVNVAGLCGNFVFPIIKQKVYCHSDVFGLTETDTYTECYALTMLITCLSYIVGFTIFLSCFRFFIERNHIQYIFKKIFKCTIVAIRNKKEYSSVLKDKASKLKLLDYSRINKKTSKEFVEDIRKAIAVSFVFLPFPIFWSLYEQEASKWLFQANQMNGNFGQDHSIVIQPEQMLAVNLLCCVIAIPIKNFCLNPILAKYGILNKSTSKMIFGYFLAAVSFLIAGSLQYFIDSSLIQDMPSVSQNQLLVFTKVEQAVFQVKLNSEHESYHIDLEHLHKYDNLQPLDFPITIDDLTLSWENVSLAQGHRTYIWIRPDEHVPLQTFSFNSSILFKSFPVLKIIKDMRQNTTISEIRLVNNFMKNVIEIDPDQDLFQFEPGNYTLKINGIDRESYLLKRGSVYVLHLCNIDVGIITVFQGVTITIWAQLPQIITLTFAELFLCISALDFAYFEAPESMRTIMQAINYTTMFSGNVLVILFTSIFQKFDFLTRFGYDYFIEAAIAIVGTFALKLIIQWYERQLLLAQEREEKSTMNGSFIENANRDGPRKVSIFLSSDSQVSTQSKRSIINWSSNLISNEINHLSMHSLNKGL